MLAHLGSKRPPTHPSCFVRGALVSRGLGVCTLCVRTLGADSDGGGVGGGGVGGVPQGGVGAL